MMEKCTVTIELLYWSCTDKSPIWMNVHLPNASVIHWSCDIWFHQFVHVEKLDACDRNVLRSKQSNLIIHCLEPTLKYSLALEIASCDLFRRSFTDAHQFTISCKSFTIWLHIFTIDACLSKHECAFWIRRQRLCVAEFLFVLSHYPYATRLMCKNDGDGNSNSNTISSDDDQGMIVVHYCFASDFAACVLAFTMGRLCAVYFL